MLTASEQPIIPDTSNEQLLSELSIATVNSNVSVSGDQGGSDCTDQAAMEMKTPKLFEIERAQHRFEFNILLLLSKYCIVILLCR